MDEREAEPLDMREVIDGYLTRLGWEHEWEFLPEQFLVTCNREDEGRGLDICVGWNADYLHIFAPRLATVPSRGKLAVFTEVMSLHWDTCLPKFEWDHRDGELRAAWSLPIAAGPPSYEHFAQLLGAFGDAVLAAHPALEKAIQRARGSLSGEAGERIPEAAELRNLGRDLVDLAEKKEILPMYVREDLVEALVAGLGGPRQQLLLVGESGTGKNAVVQALATWIAENDPRVLRGGLQGRHIYECVPHSFQLSCVYAHDLENKMQLVAENCAQENAIIFLDQAHLAVTAGSVSDDPDRTIANQLLPFMSRNEMTVVAATDSAGLKHMKKKNARFAEAFHTIQIPEPSPEQTLLMVRDRMHKFADGRGITRSVRFADGVDERLLELSDRFLRTRSFPGKALELLKEAVAYCSGESDGSPITAQDIEATVGRMSGLRKDVLRSDTPLTRNDVSGALRRSVIGQDAAVNAVADVVLAYKAELTPPGRPISTMFFAGPTGVGKTQLARSLAEYLFGSDEALLRYDMSEYADANGFTKLCGSAGARGEPGRLVADVTAKPFSIILFDEIEKAHQSVFNVLLGVLGEGRMTDETGRLASFLNSIIIMTSNVGAHLYGRSAPGFSTRATKSVAEGAIRGELERRFAPEFINRLSHLVCFTPLDEHSVRQIAGREVMAVANRGGLVRRHLRLTPSDALLDHLVATGYSQRYGARSMQRTVEDVVTAPLAEFIAARPQLRDAEVRLGWQDDHVDIDVSE